MILKKLLGIFLLFLAGCISTANAATYYTTGSGDWGTDAIWSTDTNGTGATWGSLTIVAGDIIYIDDDITLNNPGGIDITVDVTIVVDAVLSIEKI